MSLRSLVRAWNEFFFAPQPPAALGLYRILYGLLVVADLILLRPDWLTWYGPHAFVSMATMRQMAAGPRINLFTVLPPSDAWIGVFFWIFLLFAVFLTLGFLSRTSSIVVFVSLASIHQRNLFVLHSGDTLLRISGFFLMFAPTGAALSVDRLLRIWRGKEDAEPRRCSPWAQRLIQIQTAAAYLATFWWKSQGSMWVDGMAAWYAGHLDEFRRFPAPWTDSVFAMRLAAWYTLATEFALGALVWFKELRYWVLLAGVLLHLSLEYSMNVPLFQWTALASYVLFVYPADLAAAWGWIRARLAPRLGEPVAVIYDGAAPRAARAANLLRALDVFGRLRLVDLRSAEAGQAAPELDFQSARGRLLFCAAGAYRVGFDGLRRIARLVPLLWPLAPFSAAPQPASGPLSAARAAK